MNDIINALKEVTNKHFPIRKTSNTQQRLLKKPWITNGLLFSIKERQKMFRTHFLSKDTEKVKQYKIYNNKLNKIKELAKRNYYASQFNLHKQNIKATWALIGTLIHRKKKSTTSVDKLFYNNRCCVEQQDICRKPNSYFVNVGPNLADNIPYHNDSNPVQHITRKF